MPKVRASFPVMDCDVPVPSVSYAVHSKREHFVGNLPFRAEQEDVIELFAQFGEVVSVPFRWARHRS